MGGLDGKVGGVHHHDDAGSIDAAREDREDGDAGGIGFETLAFGDGFGGGIGHGG